jgi:anti-sigma factor RsiW
MPSPRVTDELLSAYVDGELGAADRADVEAWLRAHPDEAERVRAWGADREALRTAYFSVAQEPVPERLAQTVWRRRPAWLPAWLEGWGGGGDAERWPTWGLAAGAAALFVLGAALGAALTWQWKERQLALHSAAATRGAAASSATATAARGPIASQGWLQRAAFAHGVYTIEPRHAVEVRAQEEHLARWLTRRIEAPVKLFDLRDQGFELVGGRLLPDGAGKGAQLMYQDPSGKRITVYLRKPEPGTDTAFRYEQQGALGMFYWVEEKTGFALVGDLPKERLLALAKSIYEQDAVLPAPSLTPPASAPAATASSPGK